MALFFGDNTQPKSEAPAEANPAPGGRASLDRRRFLASVAGGVGGLLIAGSLDAFAVNGTAAAATTNNLSASPAHNPTWPYATDGFLYDYIAGNVIAINASAVTVLGAAPCVFEIAIQMTAATQIYCRGLASSTSQSLEIGDRVEFGTSFSTAGARLANWVVVNGLAGWSDVSDSEPPYISIIPTSGAPYADNTVRLLRVTQATRVTGPDNKPTFGSADTLTPGDHITWTGVASLPGTNPGDVWALALNYLHQA